jgi:hypothetical protein
VPKEPSFETTWVAAILVICGLPFMVWLLIAEPSVDGSPCQPFFGEVDDVGSLYDEPSECGVERDRRLAGGCSRGSSHAPVGASGREEDDERGLVPPAAGARQGRRRARGRGTISGCT